MSESEQNFPPASKYDKYAETSDIERAAIELAIDFIDSRVLGSIEISLDETGLEGITVTRDRFSDPIQIIPDELDDDPDEPAMGFSAEFVAQQMSRVNRSAVSLAEIEGE